MSDAIISAIIGAVLSIIVCLLNNYYKQKSEEKNREEREQSKNDATKKQIEDLQVTYLDEILKIKEDYSDQINDLKTDVYSKFQELQSVLTTSVSDTKHQYEMIKMEIKVLQEKQDKYNHLQERTMALETTTKIQEEQLNFTNRRIEDLEKK